MRGGGGGGWEDPGEIRAAWLCPRVDRYINKTSHKRRFASKPANFVSGKQEEEGKEEKKRSQVSGKCLLLITTKGSAIRWAAVAGGG